MAPDLLPLQDVHAPEARDHECRCGADGACEGGGQESRERPVQRPTFTGETLHSPLPTGELEVEEVCGKAREEGLAASSWGARADHMGALSTLAAETLDRPGFGKGFDPRYLAIAAVRPPGVEDWPGRVAMSVVLQGCPWRCTYCSSTDLQSPRVGGTVPWDDVVVELEARRGRVGAVVFTGGEPTRQGALPEAMRIVRSMGYEVGLLTAGAFPARLELALEHCDWVGLDIKATPEGYTDVVRTGMAGRRAWSSLEVVRDAGVPYEVRLTVDPVTHTRADVLDTVREIVRVSGRAPVLQEVRPHGTNPSYAAELAGRRLGDVLLPDDLPDLARR
ncbi:anaerobic ribonucleoside-triphosphate reductase activating protein [Demequina sp. NBRC 110052]|uniref:anaerobic ribonucleoside-triphosphate reductase activating protein n=1 Tax=Demequina sp. NBRC 110052 TaxID=1570341 RepID=UPI000A0127EF|nr:anaerobic ribonucleoside-triphosphate reductase activating protein [Demequina sp. NBRC 110052]